MVGSAIAGNHACTRTVRKYVCVLSLILLDKTRQPVVSECGKFAASRFYCRSPSSLCNFGTSFQGHEGGECEQFFSGAGRGEGRACYQFPMCSMQSVSSTVQKITFGLTHIYLPSRNITIQDWFSQIKKKVLYYVRAPCIPVKKKLRRFSNKRIKMLFIRSNLQKLSKVLHFSLIKHKIRA